MCRSWEKYNNLYCTPIKFTVQPDCEPPVMYFPDGITVNSGGLQYMFIIIILMMHHKNLQNAQTVPHLAYYTIYLGRGDD